MARYIDADLLIKELKELQGLYSPSLSKVANDAVDLGLSLSMRTARKIPTIDLAKVTRCEKCKHKETCEQYLYIDSNRTELVYCSYGEPQ